MFKKILDVLVPRFVVDQVAAVWVEDRHGWSLQPICRVEDLLPDDQYDIICRVRCLNVFGFALFPTFLKED